MSTWLARARRRPRNGPSDRASRLPTSRSPDRAVRGGEGDRLELPTPEQMLDRIDLTILRRLEGALQGEYPSLIRGGGVDFTDLREYRPEDDTRHIDWNVTARMNEAFVRQFDQDRDVTAWFLLDRTASMDFGGDPDKRQMVDDLVVALARVLTKHGNRVGAMSWAHSTTSVIEPGGGRRQVLRLAGEMLGTRSPAVQRALGPAGAERRPTDLASLGEHALRSLRRRSLVFVVSDFLSEPGWERPFAALARRHDVVALHIVDPAETALPDVGIMIVEDVETGEQLFVDSSDAAFRTRFAEAGAARIATMHAHARRSRIDLHTITTSDDVFRALVRIAGARRRLRGSRR